VTDAASARWEEFARRDSHWHVDPRLGTTADSEAFIEGGRGIVEQALDWAGPIISRDRALEIGCGVGRDTTHLARHFAQVDGVDVSPTMVALACERGLPENVRLHVVPGDRLDVFDDRSFAFVFSHLVFQHVPEDAVIESYLKEIARVLMPAGVAVLQFDTRPASPIAALAQRLPDVLLPRARRRGMRRHRRRASQIRGLGRAAGLVLAGERDPDTAEHWFRWRLDEHYASTSTPRSPRTES
jgi:SAM-dependent methyltransferase